MLARYENAAADYPGALAAYQAKVTGASAPRGLIPPLPPGGQRAPAALYNGMVSPLLRYAIRGVLWYQGESNTPDPQLYRKLFPAMIGAWRKAWGEGEFPFLYVQLPGFLARHPQPTESRWAELREAQAQSLGMPHTGMAVTIDIGDEHNMHPPDKQDVAHRLALIAESQVYGKPGVIASGPVFSRMDIAGDGSPHLHAYGRGPGSKEQRAAQGLRHRGGGPKVRLGGCADRRGEGDRAERVRAGAGGGAVRVGRFARLRPLQQSRAARRALPGGAACRRGS